MIERLSMPRDLSLLREGSALALIFCLVAPAAVLAQAAAPQGAAPQSQAPGKPTFDIFEYQVLGNTTLPITGVERAVYPYLGEHKTIDDVEEARSDLEKKYRDGGFGTVTVTIPEQSVLDGVVLLQVNEGRIEHLQVIGARYYSQGRIKEGVEGLAEGKVPNLTEVQKEIVAVNNVPDRKVTPILRPGKEPGTTDVDLEVEDHLPLHGSLSLDNHYTPLTSAGRLTASLDYDNLFQSQQRLGLLYQVAPQNYEQSKLWSASYIVPTGGQSLAFSFVRSESASISGVGGVDVFGRGKIIGLHDIIPLPAGPAGGNHGAVFTQVINLGVDYKDFDQNVVIGANPNQGYATPIRYAPVSASYSTIWTKGRNEWDFGTTIELGMRSFGSGQADFDAKRYNALGNFAILKLNLSHTEPLPFESLLYGKIDGQVADQPLVSNEQIVVGGVGSVRGYLSASATGDSGAQGTLELRSPELAPSWLPTLSNLELHAFVDGAYVRILSPLPGQTPTYELASTGVGLRARSGTTTSLDVDLGWPTRRIQYTRPWSPRLQASLNLAF